LSTRARLPQQLLDVARHLAKREPKRPREGSLRRAVSSAYYALFHLLVHDACSMLLRGEQRLRCHLARVFNHNEMKAACHRVLSGHLSPSSPKSGMVPRRSGSKPAKQTPPVKGAQKSTSVPPPPRLVAVAQAFVDLQEARHAADYAVDRKFTRTEVLGLIAQAEQAFVDWAAIEKDPLARLFLLTQSSHRKPLPRRPRQVGVRRVRILVLR
jgi:uncharacterized protein (UPF0332 family)